MTANPFGLSIAFVRNQALLYAAALGTLQQCATATTPHLPVLVLKGGYQEPQFADLVFALGPRLYAVLFDPLGADGQSAIPEEARQALRDAAREYNAIACRMPLRRVAGQSPEAPAHYEPTIPGWGLLELDGEASIKPFFRPDEPPTPPSEWEANVYAVGNALQWLADHRCGEVRSVCLQPGAVPQLWFHDLTGGDSWMIVSQDDAELDSQALLQAHPNLAGHDGYLCRVPMPPFPETRRGILPALDLAPPRKIHAGSDGSLDGEHATALGDPPPQAPEDAPEQEVSGKGCLLYIVGGILAALAGWLA
jgi:hypothetical protein